MEQSLAELAKLEWSSVLERIDYVWVIALAIASCLALYSKKAMVSTISVTVLYHSIWILYPHLYFNENVGIVYFSYIILASSLVVFRIEGIAEPLKSERILEYLLGCVMVLVLLRFIDYWFIPNHKLTTYSDLMVVLDSLIVGMTIYPQKHALNKLKKAVGRKLDGISSFIVLNRRNNRNV